MPSPIPDNVINKELYSQIKEEIRTSLTTRWGAYASDRLVKTYLARGGRYSGEKNNAVGIKKWHKEKWGDICSSTPTHFVPCGRTNMEKKIPVCRPFVKVDAKTPKTFGQLTSEEIKKACQVKRKNPSKTLPAFDNI